MSRLELRNLTVRFGGLAAVNGLDLTLEPGTVHGLIGPNGAGKSTVFNCISRFIANVTGSITYGGQNLLALRPEDLSGLGIARTFQNIELFRGMMVQANLLAGQHVRLRTGIVGGALRLPAVRREERAAAAQAADIAHWLGIAGQLHRPAGSLPYGVQKLVELGRALASGPTLLLLDEPAAGLNATESKALRELLQRLRTEKGLTILLVEHDMPLVMAVCDTITVMEFGQRIACGTPDAVRGDPAVVAAYLGKDEPHA